MTPMIRTLSAPTISLHGTFDPITFSTILVQIRLYTHMIQGVNWKNPRSNFWHGINRNNPPSNFQHGVTSSSISAHNRIIHSSRFPNHPLSATVLSRKPWPVVSPIISRMKTHTTPPQTECNPSNQTQANPTKCTAQST